MTAGHRLDHYEIVALIDKGGMGEVYLARDTDLKRDVALKVLPTAFARDPERMARFQREAEVLASLNHPGIAAIFGVVRSGDELALVMELVDGPTLAESMKPGPLTMDAALDYGRQIAEALEYAHERGVVHRDLKPANIKVTPDGLVKLLDFGLAKAIEDPLSGSVDPENSPTLTLGHTRAGAILGTPAYMSPEQANGRPADRRSDVFSFGTVLFEMLTGVRAFTGESAGDTLASVLKLEPDWNRLPADTPAAIRSLLGRCLTKDRRRRLQAIGEARIILEKPAADQTGTTLALAPPQRARPIVPWLVAALATVIAGVALWGWLRPRPPETQTVMRFVTPLPSGAGARSIAISHDGSRLAFAGGAQSQIFVRPMDQLDASQLAGTEGAAYLSFSPDGAWISYVAGGGPGAAGRLMKVATAGGPPQFLADMSLQVAPPLPTWGPDGNIWFSSEGVLHRIPSGGGTAETLARPDANAAERYAAPQLLTGGRWVLVSIRAGGPGSHQVAVLNLSTGEKRILLPNAGMARYAPTGRQTGTGHIVYYAPEAGSLMAVPFDADRLAVRGSPLAMVDGVRVNLRGVALYSFSDSGTLAYVPGESGDRTLVWVDRQGAEQPVPGSPQRFNVPRLSPDSRRVAVEIQEPVQRSADVWVYDLARGARSRITSENSNILPVWTPDGKRLVYRSSRPGGDGSALVSAPADGSGPQSVLENDAFFPDSVSPDGKLVIGRRFRRGSSGSELSVLFLAEGASANSNRQSFLVSQFQIQSAQFSPDGRSVAYQSNESGRPEVFVQSYPGPGGKWPVSTDGGTDPRWARSGRELFYRNGDKMMVVDLQTGPEFRAGKPEVLFEGRYRNGYDVSPDGKRFLMIKDSSAPETQSDQLHVVVNWFEELRRRAPSDK